MLYASITEFVPGIDRVGRAVQSTDERGPAAAPARDDGRAAPPPSAPDPLAILDMGVQVSVHYFPPKGAVGPCSRVVYKRVFTRGGLLAPSTECRERSQRDPGCRVGLLCALHRRREYGRRR